MSEDLQIALGVATVFLAVTLGFTALGVGLTWARHTFPTDTARYELETGEYLHCTPQGGNDLACEVTHRKDNQ